MVIAGFGIASAVVACLLARCLILGVGLRDVSPLFLAAGSGTMSGPRHELCEHEAALGSRPHDMKSPHPENAPVFRLGPAPGLKIGSNENS